jgi:DNA (cytosine-5)-methyltransferase 1
VRQLQEKGYAVDRRELRACDYGAPTIRKRLFLIARCDGQPIVWPEPTHGAPDSAAVVAKQRKPWRTAAECIDWSIPCPSIFERAKPLAEATQRRIARGLRRYVMDAADPFIVTLSHGEGKPGAAQRWGTGARDIRTPFQTVTANSAYAVVAPTLVQTGYGERPGQAPRAPGLDKPLGTVVAGGAKHALVSAFMAKHFTGVVGHELRDPLHTVTATDHHALVSAQLVGCGGPAAQSRPRDAGEPMQTITAKGDTAIATSHLVKLRGECTGSAAGEPVPTVTASGTHIGEVRAFLVKYYSEGGQDQDCRDPMHTIPTKDRLGLVMVAGQQYQIADIGMRMLEPHELYAAQGFPSSYVIAPVIGGRRLPKHAQVRMCGNSVSPPMAAALARANVPELASESEKEVKPSPGAPRSRQQASNS